MKNKYKMKSNNNNKINYKKLINQNKKIKIWKLKKIFNFNNLKMLLLNRKKNITI